jgi:hypothetical protein
MPEMNIPPEFEQQLRQVMDVPEPDSNSLNRLRERFLTQGTAQLSSPNGATRHPVRRPQASRPSSGFFSLPLAWKFALILLAVLALLAVFSPPVVNALRGMFGYIPSVGVVDQSADVLVLDQPIQTAIGEISLTVEHAYATSEKTVVIYQYTAPAWDGRKYQASTPNAPDQPAALLLPDGSQIEMTIGRRQAADEGAIRYALEFGPLPQNTTSVTLLLNRLAGMPFELSPKNLSIALHFKPGDPNDFLYPVTLYEPTAERRLATTPSTAKPTDTQSAQVTVEPSQAAIQPTPAYGASIVLEKSVELPDGYLLIGSFHWSDSTVGQNELELGMPVISDANGQIIEYEFAQPDSYPQPSEPRVNWAFKIPGKAFAAPLRLEFYVTHHEAASAPFQFDPGSEPHTGQTYDMDVPLKVNTHEVRIVSARYDQFAPDQQAFLFTLTADTYVIGARVIDPAHPPMGGGGGSNGIPPTGVPFSSGVFIEGELPQGPLSLQIAGLDVLIPGDWVIHWAPGQ